MFENQSEIDKTIFVSNLHSCVKEEILFELFLQAGPVRKVVIPRDREGQQRSFGFVYYKHAEAVPYAIELLDGIWLYGRPIRLKYTLGNSHQDCETASPNLQNGLVGNSKDGCSTQCRKWKPLQTQKKPREKAQMQEE